MNKTTETLKLADIEDLQDSVTKALKKAFQLGQTYWMQADSESLSQNKKADETQAKFYELEDETRAAIREALAEPVCKRCNGTKLVSDGEIDNIGGADLEVPIECVKDCPDCAEPVKQEPVAFVSDIHLSRYTLEWNGSPLPEGTELYANPLQTVDNYYLEQMAEEAECVKLSLDKANVPTTDESGKVYSMWGRVCRYAAPVDAKAIRAEALEEAAKMCEDYDSFYVESCAAAIRGLK